MFKQLNEGFNKRYTPLTESNDSIINDLKDELYRNCQSMLNDGNYNLKDFEVIFQSTIETFFPGNMWWEVCTLNIFWDLFEHRDPFTTIENICKNIKPEFANGSVQDLTLMDLDDEDAIYDIYDGNANGIFTDEFETPKNESKKIREKKCRRNRKNAKLPIKSLNEEPEFILSDDELNDPKELDFKKIMKRNADAEAQAKAEQERQERIAAAKEKYKDVLNGIETMDTDDAIEKLFGALVPPRGKSETVAGELVRATMRILYRDYNDGDKFFEGYGLETCGSSANYLYDMGITKTISTVLNDTYRYADYDDKYTEALKQLSSEVITHILNNPELLTEPNETDSREYTYEFIEEHQPIYDYDFTLPYNVQKYMDAGHIDYMDIESIIESNIESNWNIKYDSVDVSDEYVNIYGLTKEGYDEVERWEMWDDDYWEYELKEWESEYGDPDEDEDDDDIDESMSINEAPVYDMSPNYDARKSFYGKARVDDQGNEKTLYSYNTPVCKIVNGKVTMLPRWDESQTTLRHVKEFLKQNGFDAQTLAQMRKDYSVKNEKVCHKPRKANNPH